MIRKIVSCPACALQFVTGRARTFCPGCHQMVDVVER